MPRGISSRTISQANASAAASSLNSAACRPGLLRGGHISSSSLRRPPEIALSSVGQHALEIDALMHGRARLGAVYVDSDNRIAVALYKGTADRFLIFGRALVLAVAGVPKVQHEESSPVAVYWLQSFPRNN